ncbi:MAG: M48 family metallopeptidase [Planctomycetota bacterium]
MSDSYRLESSFEGAVFRRGDTQAQKRARIQVGPEGVSAEIEDGRSVELPWKGMRLWREPDGSAIHCVAADRSVTVFSSDPDFLRALEAAGGNDLNDALSRMQGEHVTSHRHHLLSCSLVLLALAAIFWGLPRLFRATVDGAVSALPYSVDETIGEAVFDSMDLGGAELQDPILQGAVQAILDRLSPHSSLPAATFTFKIVDSEQVNAFALPGGFIVVYTGLLAEADDPGQVAGVLAHEMAHVTQRHGLRRIAHSLGVWAAISTIFGSADGLTSIAVELFTMANVNDYSQDQETAADLEGARMLIAGRIDPAGLASFFAKLGAEQGDVPDALAWFSTHPQHKERVAAITAYADEHARGVVYEPLDIDWERVLERLED